MKKLIYVCIGMLIGCILAIKYKLADKKDVFKGSNMQENIERTENGVAETSVSEMILDKEAETYEKDKKSTIEELHSRHESVAIIMNESVNAIRKNIKVSDNTNSQIDEISDELDKMLSEG